MTLEWDRGFVLHRRPWRETSLWLEAFTREAGKVAFVARGGRKPRRFAAMLQPFQPLLLKWRRRGELATLTAAEAEGSLPVLTGTALYCGFYINELLSCLLARDDPHPGLFDAYRQVLTELTRAGDLEESLRRFELKLLKEIGYAPILDHEVEYGADIVAEQRYRYCPQRGPIVDDRGWLHGRTLLELQVGRLTTPETRREAKRLLRLLLDFHLQGRPLRSRMLFRQNRKDHDLQTDSPRG